MCARRAPPPSDTRIWRAAPAGGQVGEGRQCTAVRQIAEVRAVPGTVAATRRPPDRRSTPASTAASRPACQPSTKRWSAVKLKSKAGRACTTPSTTRARSPTRPTRTATGTRLSGPEQRRAVIQPEHAHGGHQGAAEAARPHAVLGEAEAGEVHPEVGAEPREEAHAGAEQRQGQEVHDPAGARQTVTPRRPQPGRALGDRLARDLGDGQVGRAGDGEPGLLAALVEGDDQPDVHRGAGHQPPQPAPHVHFGIGRHGAGDRLDREMGQRHVLAGRRPHPVDEGQGRRRRRPPDGRAPPGRAEGPARWRTPGAAILVSRSPRASIGHLRTARVPAPHSPPPTEAGSRRRSARPAKPPAGTSRA